MLDRLSVLMSETPQQVAALIVSGAAGAYVRAVFTPENSWRKRTTEGIAGALSAIFLGGIVGHMIDSVTDGGPWAYLAAGFVMGEGGIAAVRGFRQMIFKDHGK